MAIPLRVLLVEDSEADALLLIRELRHGGFEPNFEQVDNAADLDAALTDPRWEVVICDYKLPQFDGIQALSIFKRKSLDIPFIIVSGLIGEEVAVAMMKAGAHDYILKNNLARLVPALTRELREAEERRELRRAERARSHLAALVESSDDAILSTTPEGVIMTWNHGAQKVFGYTASEAIGHALWFLVPSQYRQGLSNSLSRALRDEEVERLQTVSIRKDARIVDVSVTFSDIKDPQGNLTGVSIIARDITERKRIEAEREKLLKELQDAMAQVKTLSGLLPICASCKKIRDDTGYWHQVEIYIKRHSRAEFTHGFCPECLKRLYPQFVPTESRAPAPEIAKAPAA